MVRNSVGENCYVSDEVIMSRAKQRVRVGDTDAEGRMIMADVLCYVSLSLLIYVITRDLILKLCILFNNLTIR